MWSNCVRRVTLIGFIDALTNRVYCPRTIVKKKKVKGTSSIGFLQKDSNARFEAIDRGEFRTWMEMVKVIIVKEIPWIESIFRTNGIYRRARGRSNNTTIFHIKIVFVAGRKMTVTGNSQAKFILTDFIHWIDVYMSRSPEDKPDGKVYTGWRATPPRPGWTKLWPASIGHNTYNPSKGSNSYKGRGQRQRPFFRGQL